MSRSVAVVAALVCGSGCTEGVSVPANVPQSVLLVTIDTLRADHLPTYGYFRDTAPNIERFAAQGIVFERTVTPMATTLPAHTSIMTGTRPKRHEIVRNGLVFESEPGLRTAAELLEAAGFATVGVVSASPLATGTGISTGFQRYDDPPAGPRRAADTTNQALAELDRLGDRPFFMWVHFWDPHDPYDPPAPFDQRFDKDDGIREFVEERGTKLFHRRGRAVFDVLDINNRYDGEIAYTDRELGRLLDGLRSRNMFDDTTIVVTADHGEGLWQHDWHDHGRIFNEEIFVPLIIKPTAALGRPAERTSRMATTIDILPTLGAMLDLPFPADAKRQFEGIDLFDDRAVRPYVISERVHRHREGWEKGGKIALTGADYKMFRLDEGSDQLFDLRIDPHELDEIAKTHPEVRTKLARYLGGQLATDAPPQKKKRRDVSPELIEKLRTLGYVQ